ncbi:MAG: hypothetical protein JNJ65_02815 [Cyclobacteriaceae bacterium]|nr:hypothetical protein [Cyclobacteriaceae bacterium]
MNRFPNEFEDLLTRKGRKILRHGLPESPFTNKRKTPVVVIDGIINERLAQDCMKLLNQHFSAHLKTIAGPIDKDELRNMKENYSEKLAKTLRMQTLEIGGRRSNSFQIATQCGLIQMLNSSSLKAFGEAVTGSTFGTPENNQIILYRHEDYVSPHNDHHPENRKYERGIMTCTSCFLTAT